MEKNVKILKNVQDGFPFTEENLKISLKFPQLFQSIHGISIIEEVYQNFQHFPDFFLHFLNNFLTF